MTFISFPFFLIVSLLSTDNVSRISSFQISERVRTGVIQNFPSGHGGYYHAGFRLTASGKTNDDVPRRSSIPSNTKSDNKAMAFLKKIGKVGGAKVDFGSVIGLDEGSGGAKVSSDTGKWNHGIALKRARHSYSSCVDSGIIDDLSETFPMTSSGTLWRGVTDTVMGGSSSGSLVREEFHGRLSNVLTANVRLQNDAGFVQMVTDLSLDHSVSNTVDASIYNGVEFDMFYQGDAERESFNVHLKDSNCVRKFSSYRAKFNISQGKWTTVRLPWSKFKGFGLEDTENVLNSSAIRRIGLVAIGKEMDVRLAVSSIRFI